MSDTFIINSLKPFSIMNLDENNKKGSHWIAIYQQEKTLYIYDSFARNNILNKFIKTMKHQYINIHFVNKKQIKNQNS